MADSALPTVVLAGSDRRPAALPDEARDKHPIAGYKGVGIRVAGRPLIACVLDRLRDAGRFGPLYVVGPEAAYGELGLGRRLVAANGSFGDNVRAGVEAMARAHPGSPVAFTVCDILPDADTLRRVMRDYDRDPSCDLWFPMIHAPRDRASLGPSAWKPGYRVAETAGGPPLDILPGHLAVARTDSIRLDFLYRMFELGYRTRNRSIGYRRRVMLQGILAYLLGRDLRGLLARRAPTLTWSVVRAGLAASGKLRDGTVCREELERTLEVLFIRRRRRRAMAAPRVRMPIVEGLSLALDLDTLEEARAAGGEVSGVRG